jgi:hypothetical protein
MSLRNAREEFEGKLAEKSHVRTTECVIQDDSQSSGGNDNGG